MGNPVALTHATGDNAPTDHPIEPSILAAIDQGRGQRGQRGQRGGQDPQAWSRHRDQVLTLAQRGQSRGRIGGELGLTARQMVSLVDDACGAMLRCEAISAAADRVGVE